MTFDIPKLYLNWQRRINNFGDIAYKKQKQELKNYWISVFL